MSASEKPKSLNIRIIILIIMVRNIEFVDREEELAFLQEKYSDERFQCIVLYGRRRVGKTELIKQFVRQKPHLYFLADKRGTETNLDRFNEKVAEFLGQPKVEVKTFDRLFSYLHKNLRDQRLIIAIDEFSYLVEKDEAIPSLFQLIIDEELSSSKVFLIFSGSSVSLMEQGVLSAKSPLYGRRTGQMKIAPLGIKEILQFFPNYAFQQAVEVYSVFGGIPFYLQKVNDSLNVLENVRQQIIKKGEILYEEIDFLLKEELRDPSSYKSILEAIARGATKTVEIANGAKIEAKDLDKYLKVLMNLGYVKRITPVTEKPSTRRSFYAFADHFFRFWFTFCYPRQSDLEMGEIGNILATLRVQFPAFVGKAFEQVCFEFLQHTKIFPFQRLGTWWQGETEIDLVAIHEFEKSILFAECKWQERVRAEEIIHQLKNKAALFPGKASMRRETYAIFAKSFKEKRPEKGVLLFDLKDIEKGFR